MRPERWLLTIPLRLRSLFRRTQTDIELDDELRDHIERRTEEYVGKGVPPEEARRQALLEIGGIEKRKEECRDTRRVTWIQDLIQDLHFGLRMLRKSPGFTFVAIVTLALGVGANTAIFSMVNAVLLQPLPYKDSQRLVRLEVMEPGSASPSAVVSAPDFVDYKKGNQVFEEMAAGFLAGKALTGGSEPTQISGFEVTPQIFHLLGISPLLGRTFAENETQPGRNRVVILSYGLWQRAFGGEQAIIGKTVTLDGDPYDVVGVMPQSLRFPNLWWGTKAEFWIPLNLDQPAWRTSRDDRWLWVLARVKKGVTLPQAQADMTMISYDLQKQYPHADTGISARVIGLQNEQTKQARPALLMLFAAVGLLLLVACANIASLLLAKAVARGREIAIRLAIGSGKARLIRQLLTESVLLFLLGGLAGLLVGWGVLRLLLHTAPEGYIPGIIHVQLSGWVLAFTFGIAFLTGLLAGLVPAVHSSKANPQLALKEGGRTATMAHNGPRNILTVGEIALALMVLIGAGLAIKSLSRLMGVEPGFDYHNVLKANLALPQARYKSDEQVTAFYERLLDKLRVLPGTESASLTDFLPLQGNPTGTVYIEGQPLPKDVWSNPEVATCDVMPDYFQTMHIQLLKGRDFNLEDGPNSPKVAVINETMAHLFWPTENAIGKRFARDYRKPDWITVVGVVGDVRESGLAEAALPEMYFPETQSPARWMAVVLRTQILPASEANALRNVVHSLDPQLPVYGIETLSRIVSRSSQQQQFEALLLGLFAAAALALAVIGIYGVISYSAAQRMHEFGIRVALGAQEGDVLRMVVGQGFKLTLTGIAIGIVGALGLTRFLTSLLYGVTPTDLPTFILVSLILTAAALLASYVPARRAMRVDPMVALRYE